MDDVVAGVGARVSAMAAAKASATVRHWRRKAAKASWRLSSAGGIGPARAGVTRLFLIQRKVSAFCSDAML
ncbi:hypothetical protein STANM309S_04124 [Streptomyces tanashiensis]